MANMIILRGAPGSGKSYYAAKLGPYTVVSADDFFVDDFGEYSFDPKWLGRAHGACLRACVEAILRREDIVVDNTNSKPQELIPYLALCAAFGYSCQVVRMVCDREVAWSRQTHCVSREKFDAIFSTVEQQQIPKLYRGAPWLTCVDEHTDGREETRAYRLPLPQKYRSVEAPTVWWPYSGARCTRCGLIIVYAESAGETARYCDHECDTCECEDGKERPGEPFAGAKRPGRFPAAGTNCNCGVSMGIRSDHESQCAATYLQRD